MKRKQVLVWMALAIAATTVLAAGCKKKSDVEVVATVETAIEKTTEAETTAPVFTWEETLFGTTKNLMITKEVDMYLEPRFDAEVSHQTQEDVYYWFMGYVNDGDWYVIKEFPSNVEVYYVPANEFPGLSIEKTDDVEETTEAIETEETAEAVETTVEETIGVVESVEAAKSQAVTSTKAQTADATVQARLKGNGESSMGKKVLKFYWMHEDEVCTEVAVYTDPFGVDYDNITNEKLKMLCFPGHTITRDWLNGFFERRVWSRHRPDSDELLNNLSLINFNPLDIVKITHGRLTSDNFWIKFEGEDLSYKDVK